MATSIFSCVPETHLCDILQTLQAFTNLAIQLLDERGTPIRTFGKTTGYCALLKDGIFPKSSCAQLHAKAGLQAQELGEAYIFSCHANLNHIAYPLVNQGDLLGSVIIGPFLMDTPDSTLVTDIAEQYRITPALCLELYDELTALTIISPPKVQLLKKMIEFMLSPLIQNERAVMMQSQEKLLQQSRINETIQMYKGKEETVSARYFYTKEKELLTKVRLGNVSEVKGLLNDLLGYVLFSQGGDLEAVRIRAIELTTLLSRVAIEGGAETDSVYQINNKLLPAFYQQQDLEELCLLLQEVAEHFMAAMFRQRDKGNPYIRKALRYIADHYSEHLSITQVSDYVQLSNGYFSTLFSQVVGMNFREYLCSVRIEASKQLLLSTNYSLADIAVAVGFPDQSYYCKTFKKLTGLTPGKFRS
jgi:YesN/AraC family two-component response regulator